MNKLLILISLLLFFTSCSHAPPQPHHDFPNVDPMVKSLVKDFDMYYRYYRHSALKESLVVKFGIIKQSKKAQGVYHRIKDYTMISSKHWHHLTYSQKEIVVFHELGHHVLKRAHDWSKDRILKNGCARSIMYYQGVTDKCYIKYRKYYIKELFKWSR
jgi:hypothetical protein